MRFAHQTNTWGGVVGHPAGVTSPKDLYYLTPGSDREAIEDIAAAGYEGFEIFDGNLLRYRDQPDALQDLMRASDLELVAVYSGAAFIYADSLPDEMARIEIAARLGVRHGARFLVVGGGAVRADGVRESDYAALAGALDRVCDLVEGLGLRPAYHPHLGTIGESGEQLDRILSLSRIPLCPDTAHVVAGGADVVDVVRRYRDRIEYIHFKDWDGSRFVPLGEGSVDVHGLVEALRGSVQEWWAVELDETERDPREMAAKSLAHLRNQIQG